MKLGSAILAVTVLLLVAGSTSAKEDVQRPKPPVSMLPPAPFVTTAVPQTTQNTTTPPTTTASTAPQNTTTANMTTTTPSTHNTTTANMTTTTPSTQNTTTANMTTTTPSTQNTTTANMTTTTSASQNTTTHSTTTTTGAPTPQPTPTVIPVGNYTVKNGTKTCVMVLAGIQVQVNNSKVAGTFVVQPNITHVAGKCDTTALLQLVFAEGFISLSFTTNDTTKMVYVSAVTVNITYAFKAGELYTLTKKNESVQLFSVAQGHSYSCKSESVFMGDGAYLKFSSQRMQAFNFSNNQFGPPDLCKADQPDYRVAIAVGVVLIILIVIVLVAYALSRKKRTDGYQSL